MSKEIINNKIKEEIEKLHQARKKASEEGREYLIPIYWDRILEISS